MSDNATDTAAAETSGDSDTTDAAATADSTTDTDAAANAALGDAGKKALDAMKAERKAANDRAKELEAQLAALTAKVEGREAEHAAEQKARELDQARIAKADEKILKAEVRAAAKGVLADPADAFKFLDLSAFEVGADGEVDASALTDALNTLIEEKPYLAAQSGKRFQGTADGGARNDAAKVSQLSQSDMDRLSPEEKVAAYESGRFDSLLGR